LFVALHGRFERHPWQDVNDDPMLDYLIRDRTQAMGWSMDVGAGVGLGTIGVEGGSELWRVRDAGPEPVTPTSGDEPVAWFHVMARTPASAPLPIRALLAGCEDCLGRLGVLRLDAVQILLAADLLDPSRRVALFPHVDGVGWWLNSNPRAKTTVRASLNSGRDDAAPRATSTVLQRLQGLDQDVVRPDARSLADGHPGAPSFVLSDRLWLGPPGRYASFTAELREWSLDTIGWLASLIADLLADEGVHVPTLLTVAREQRPG
jgi:hypothetical protein